MEIVVLVGVPGSGKTTLAKTRFPHHKRINLDTLHTRSKEFSEMSKNLENGCDMIIDNTNTTRKTRLRYIEIAKLFGIPIRAIYLDCPLDLALKRNSSRVGKEQVPDRAVRLYYKIIEPPTKEEGFDSVEKIPVSENEAT